MDDLELALRLADSADEITSSAFAARNFAVRYKHDGTPVTEVDITVEQALMRFVADVHPTDAFVCEESGTHGESSRTWIIDGIDGTASFVRGASTWGTLIALRDDEEVVVGVASSPELGRRWWASRGAGAWTASLSTPSVAKERLEVSGSRLDARWSVMPSAERLEGWRQRAAQQSVDSLGATEVAGYDPLLVAAGDLDGSLVLFGGPWDHAPFVVLVEEAGGRFSDLWGGRRLDSRTAVYSNGLVHDELLSVIAPFAPALPTGHYGSP